MVDGLHLPALGYRLLSDAVEVTRGMILSAFGMQDTDEVKSITSGSSSACPNTSLVTLFA